MSSKYGDLMDEFAQWGTNIKFNTALEEWMEDNCEGTCSLSPFSIRRVVLKLDRAPLHLFFEVCTNARFLHLNILAVMLSSTITVLSRMQHYIHTIIYIKHSQVSRTQSSERSRSWNGEANIVNIVIGWRLNSINSVNLKDVLSRRCLRNLRNA